MTEHNFKHIIEGLLFASESPLSIEQISSVFEKEESFDQQTIRPMLEALQQDYQDRGVELVELASGFQFQVRAAAAPWISNLWQEKPPRQSPAMLETLALIAYRQPITRGEISEIRGVGVSSMIIKTLLEYEWVRVVGHREIPGRPALLATTQKFLDDFGLKNIDLLPRLEEIDINNLDAVTTTEPRQQQIEEEL
jgi:segregation and condensation protein B